MIDPAAHRAPDADAHPAALRDTLRAVLADDDGIAGVLLASTDGLLVAAEFDAFSTVTRPEVETFSAMAAATAGIAEGFAGRLALGADAGCVVHGSVGSVAVQRVDRTGVLVLFAAPGTTVGRLHVAMRRALPRVRTARGGA